MALRLVMGSAAPHAVVIGAGLLLAGATGARADCAWDIRMAASDIAEVEATIPLAENPDLPLGPGVELPPQRRSTLGPVEAADEEGLVSGATPSGQEVVPDAEAMTGQTTEGRVPGPAEVPVALSPAPGQGLTDAPSRSNEAAEDLARAKLKVQEAQSLAGRGDEQACFSAVEEAQDLVAEARTAIVAAAGGAPPPASSMPPLAEGAGAAASPGPAAAGEQSGMAGGGQAQGANPQPEGGGGTPAAEGQSTNQGAD